jgi:hypothetical protein
VDGSYYWQAGISKQVTDGQILPVEVNFSVAGNSKINLK